MRFVVTALLWVVTTVALAVTVPALWLQSNVVDEDGYAALSTAAARSPVLQQAMADELAVPLRRLAAEQGYPLTPRAARDITAAYTGSTGFPGQFAQANRIAHRWVFTDTVPPGPETNQWLIDIAPMFSDPSFREVAGTLDLDVPETLAVPVTVPSVEFRPGRLTEVGRWGSWVTGAAAVLTAVLAVLTLIAARSRAKALVALGVSALLVGGAGWAALEEARGYVGALLRRATGPIRQVADVVVTTAVDSAHHWLNATLAAGGGLIGLGVLGVAVGALLRRA